MRGNFVWARRKLLAANLCLLSPSNSSWMLRNEPSSDTDHLRSNESYHEALRQLLVRLPHNTPFLIFGDQNARIGDLAPLRMESTVKEENCKRLVRVSLKNVDVVTTERGKKLIDLCDTHELAPTNRLCSFGKSFRLHLPILSTTVS